MPIRPLHDIDSGPIDIENGEPCGQRFSECSTARILYRMPDHPAFLQTYVWQDYDLCPKFPLLNRFLAFWLEKLEGPLHSVTVAHARLIQPAEIRSVNGEFRLH